jgi:hypothetical protein
LISNNLSESHFFLKRSLCAPDTFFVPADEKCLPKCNPECLEQCLALVVVVFTGKCNMSSDAGPVAQAIKEMLEDVCRNVADSPIAK